MRSPEGGLLDFLVGEWASVDRTYAVGGGSGGRSAGSASYEWGVGDKWLLYDFRTTLPGLGPYAVHGGVAYDPATEQYQAYAVNNHGKLLVYAGTWQDDDTLVFSLVYPEVEPNLCVSYFKGPDGTVLMKSERPDGKGGRQLYFETVLSRSGV
jgi:hypothetical protein